MKNKIISWLIPPICFGLCMGLFGFGFYLVVNHFDSLLLTVLGCICIGSVIGLGHVFINKNI